MAKILINDGIHPTGLRMLQEAGHEVVNEKIAQEDLPSQLPSFDVVCVRSATKIRKDLIEQCPKLKIIGRGGVGLDNIDVDFARSKGIEVYNTPAASSRSVAELAITHMLNIARGLNQSNRAMPSSGNSSFKQLKKAYSKGIELEGKTMGIIGFGRIGRELARIALGLGMKVMPVDQYRTEGADISVGPESFGFSKRVELVSLDDMLKNSDLISLHVPSTDKPILGAEQIDKMKEGVIIVNTARGGSVDESALLAAIQSGKVRGFGLDVFVNEPSPRQDVLTNKAASLSPHIGASTMEAQEKIGIELASQINDFFNK